MNVKAKVVIITDAYQKIKLGRAIRLMTKWWLSLTQATDGIGSITATIKIIPR